MSDVQAALELISELQNPTVDQIIEILNEVPYTSPGQAAEGVTTMFFAGSLGDLSNAGVLSSDGGTRAISLMNQIYYNATPESQARLNFAGESQIFQVATDPIFEAKMIEALGSREAFDNFMVGAPIPGMDGVRGLGYFDVLSANLAREASGDVISITPTANNMNNVWNRSELPALLDNPNVTTINGIPRATLLEFYENSGRTFDALQQVSSIVNAASLERILASGMRWSFDEFGTTAGFDPGSFLSGLGLEFDFDAVDDAAVRQTVADSVIQSLDEAQLNSLRDGYDAVDSLGLDLGGRALKVLPFLGIFLAGFNAQEAYAAGDTEGAIAIMARALSEEAGSIAVEAITGLVVGAGIVALGATAPVGIVVGISASVVAGVVGSELGGSAFDAARDWLAANADDYGLSTETVLNDFDRAYSESTTLIKNNPELVNESIVVGDAPDQSDSIVNTSPDLTVETIAGGKDLNGDQIDDNVLNVAIDENAGQLSLSTNGGDILAEVDLNINSVELNDFDADGVIDQVVITDKANGDQTIYQFDQNTNDITIANVAGDGSPIGTSDKGPDIVIDEGAGELIISTADGDVLSEVDLNQNTVNLIDYDNDGLVDEAVITNNTSGDQTVFQFDNATNEVNRIDIPNSSDPGPSITNDDQQDNNSTDDPIIQSSDTNNDGKDDSFTDGSSQTTDPTINSSDTNGDGKDDSFSDGSTQTGDPNIQGTDTDGGGIDDSFTDGSSTSDPSIDGSDTNGDGVDDSFTDGSTQSSDPSIQGSDTDGDGINDSFTDGSSTSDPSIDGSDTNGDGVDDSFTDGSTQSSDPIIQGSDTDGDGINDSFTDGSSTSDPSIDGSDTNGDGVDDSFTDGSTQSSDPSIQGSDTDGDGINDSFTDGSSTSDPSIDGSDTNGDGEDDSFTDGSSDPTDPNIEGTDTDGDGVDDSFSEGGDGASGDDSGGAGGGAGDAAGDGSDGSGRFIPRDPLVLDLDADGVELTNLEGSTAYFDLNGDGFATRTAWLSGDDAFLALDRNADGVINDITELFGSPERTGYEELGELDSNADGLINSSDERFGELELWQDKNGDGISQSDELRSLTEAGIASIDLSHVEVEGQEGADAQIARQGTFTWSDGSQGTSAETTGIAADVLFASNPTFTQFIGTVDIDPEVLAVSNIKGYGKMPDLHQAMSLDSDLKNYVLNMFNNPSASSLVDNLEQLLIRWAGVSGISIDEIDPEHRLDVNPETGMVDFRLARESFSLEQLGVIKAYSGLEALRLGDGQWFEEGEVVSTGGYYRRAYRQLSHNLLVKFAVGNGLLADIAPGLTYDPMTDLITAGTNIDSQVFTEALVNISTKIGDAEAITKQWMAITSLIEILPSARAYLLEAMVQFFDANAFDISDILPSPNNSLFDYIGIVARNVDVEANRNIYGAEDQDILISLGGNANLHGYAGDDVLQGNTGNDYLAGHAGNDVLIGGAGNDTLIDARGDNTFHYSGGNDTFTVWRSNGHQSAGQGFNRLVMSAHYYTDITGFRKERNNLLIDLADGNVLTVTDWFAAAEGISTFDLIEFADGQTYTPETLLAGRTVLIEDPQGDGDGFLQGSQHVDLIHMRGGNDSAYGKGGDDLLVGGAGSDRLFGEDGNDVLQGGTDDDLLLGGAGDDWLEGGSGNDTLKGEDGNDILLGGTGDDTLIDARGDNTFHYSGGNDTFTVWRSNGHQSAGQGFNRLVMSAHYYTDITGFRKERNNLLIDLADGNVLTVTDWFAAAEGISTFDLIEFADGQTYTPETLLAGRTVLIEDPQGDGDGFLQGSQHVDLIHMRGGNDSAYGKGGDDLLVGGAGSDRLFGEDGNDVLQGGTDDDLLLGGAGDDRLEGGSGNDTLKGEDGNDILFGGAGDDTLTDVRGDNTFHYSGGNDTFTVWRSNGHQSAGQGFNRLVMSAHYYTDITGFRKERNNLLIDLADGNVLTVTDWFAAAEGISTFDLIEFADGQTYTAETLLAGRTVLIEDPQGDGDGFLQGSQHVDLIYMRGGNDSAYGKGGDDLLVGGVGSDRLFGEDGNDVLQGGADDDLILGGAGDDRLEGGSGNDTLKGEDGNDILLGGTGDDTLIDARGDNTFHYSGGNDTFTVWRNYDYQAGQGINRLVMSAHNYSDITGFRKERNNLLIDLADGNVLTVTDWFAAAEGISTFDLIEFADGQTYTAETLLAGRTVLIEDPQGDGDGSLQGSQHDDLIHMRGGNDSAYGKGGDDLLVGGAGSDRLFGEDGNDVLQGGADDDLILGGAGDDRLEGGSGNDTLKGEDGNDILLGGTGDDTLIDARGDNTFHYSGGNDTFTVWRNYDYQAGQGINRLVMSAHNYSDITGFRKERNNLLIDLADGNVLTVTDWFAAAEGISTFDLIEFADGQTYTAETLLAGRTVLIEDPQGDGDGSLQGSQHDDLIHMRGGNDSAYGKGGDDLLVGGAGSDRLFGEDGNDVLQGGTDDDLLLGGAGDDRLEGGSGNDTLKGEDGNDILFGGAGDDTLTDVRGDNTFHYSGGNDTFTVWRNYDYQAGQGINRLVMSAHNYSDITGFRKERNNLLIDLADGNMLTVTDWFVAAEGISTFDLIEFSDGSTYTAETLFSDKKIALDDPLLGNTSSMTGTDFGDMINTLGGGGTVQAHAGDDIVTGGAGEDILHGGDGNDVLIGNQDNDTLYGNEGDDVLDGGAGNDHYDVTGGNDTVIYSAGDDTITHNGNPADETNRLVLDALQPTDVAGVSKVGDSLVINFVPEGSVTLESWFNGRNDLIQEIEFSDGSVQTTTDFINQFVFTTVGTENADSIIGLSYNDHLEGMGGNDTLVGGAGNDILSGGLGDDHLSGQGGDNTYVYTSGQDTFEVSTLSAAWQDGHNRLVLSDITPEMITEIRREISDLVLDIDGLGSARISKWFSGENFQFDTIQFGDATPTDMSVYLAGQTIVGDGDQNDSDNYDFSNLVFTSLTDASDSYSGTDAVDAIEGGLGNDTLRGYDDDDVLFGGAGDDRLYGGNQDDHLDGGAGVDRLYGDAGNDTLIGGDGNDYLYGHAGDDVLRGGQGDDYLDGQSGADTFHYELGGGQDRISNLDYDATVANRLILGDGITLDMLSYARHGNSLVIQVGEGTDQIEILNYFSSTAYHVEELEVGGQSYLLEDVLSTAELPILGATESGNTLRGTEQNNTADGLGGNDRIYGYGGNDTLAGGTGDDYLYGGNDDDHLEGGSGIDRLYGDAGNDTLIGGDGNDYLYGHAGDDVLRGGQGDDYLDGQSGADTFHYELGGGQDRISNLDYDATVANRLILGDGITLDMLSYARQGNSLVIQVGEGTDQIEILNYFSSTAYHVEELEVGGQSYLLEEVLSAAELPILGATESSNTLRGTEQNNTADGLGGNDRIYGYGGNDTLAGGTGDDYLYGGNDDDHLEGGSGVDRLYGDAGNDTLIGGDGNDYLYGHAGDDVLRGGQGDDYLDGQSGADTFHYELGGGQDRISNLDYDATVANRLILGDGITLDMLSYARHGNSLVIQVGEGTDQIEILNYFSSTAYHVEELEVGGQSYLLEDVLSTAELPILGATESGNTLRGTEQNNTADGLGGNDRIYGYGGNDTLAGGTGDDYLYGGNDDDHLEGGSGIDRLYGDAGNDTLIGGDGNDYLYGHAGDDVLRGGQGDDYLNGAAGNDTYYVQLGGGLDTVADYSTISGEVDHLIFDSTLAKEDMWFAQNGNALEIYTIGTDDKVTVNNWFSSSAYQIESIQVGNAVLLSNQVEQLVNAMSVYETPQGAGYVVPQTTQDELATVIAQTWQSSV